MLELTKLAFLYEKFNMAHGMRLVFLTVVENIAGK